MDTPQTLRQRAEQWRRLADRHHHVGTADALLEAACALEFDAYRLERAPPPTAAAPPEPAA